MEFSMNGFRTQLSNDTQALRDTIKNFIDGEFYEYDELITAMNKVIQHSNTINCVYIESDENFVDMSHIDINYLEGE